MAADDGQIRKVMTPDPDAALIQRVAVGERGAIRSFIALKAPRMLALARRMLGDAIEAEDVAQEVFVRVWKQAPNWRPGAGRFDTWMHRVALNLCYDRLRRRREDLTDDPPDQPDPSPNAEVLLQRRDTSASVQAALLSLPRRQREAIVLCHFQELSNIEAAELMGLSVEAVESLLSRARRNLRSALASLVRN